MKINKFKIRAIQSRLKESGMQGEFQTPQKTPENEVARESKEVLEQMQELLKYAMNLNNNKEEQLHQGLEYRDRTIQSTIKAAPEQATEDANIEEWIGEVCRNVASTTFHCYLNEEMTFEQAKVYCCEEILRNLGMFGDKHQLNSQFFKKIDRIMKKKVMPYLAQKYPLSQSLNANRALNRIVKEINNSEVISNDFFYNSEIVLEYRENGNYNDIIMKVLNQIISIPDSPSPQTSEYGEVSNFNDFDEYITKLFDRVYDPVWMNQRARIEDDGLGLLKEAVNQILSQKIIKDFKSAEEMDKYKEKVQQYTHYEIGRKIPESVQAFTEDQIRKGHLVVKSSQILRIMTKWCEELWHKFEDENYYIDRSQGLSMLNSKQINIVYEWARIDLKKKLKEEKNNIEKYMKSIENNLYEQEFKILQSELLSQEAPFLNRYERVCGKFSIKLVNNLKNCIVVYLNRLIHGLMLISSNLFSERMKSMPSWPLPPNLMSFKIGDLLRCRVSSHEKEVIRLYEELLSISQKNPEKLKIIRVKNRLKSGTNDLLINVRYNNAFTGELQLKVKSKAHSRFSSCSYNFSHFVYEIQRSYFGPISQMSSIWLNLDPRSQTYQQLVQSENLMTGIDNPQYYCIQNELQHQLESISNTPFICSRCGKSFSSDHFALPHRNCKICNYFQCCIRQIKQRQNNNLVDQIVEDKSIRQNLFPERCEKLPKLGIFIKIENNVEDRGLMFKLVTALEKDYLFTYKGGLNGFELAYEMKTDKERKKFMRQHVVYEYCGKQPDYFKQLNMKKAVQDYITPLYIKNCYKLEREALSLNKVANISYSIDYFKKLLGEPKESKRSVIQLQMSSHYLPNLDFIPPEMINLELVNVNLNALTNIQALTKFKKLKTLYLLSNKLTVFPPSLCQFPLKLLSIGQNQVKQLPDEFQKLQSLEIISFNSNSMKQFPLVLTRLSNLTEIYANSNQFETIPEDISKLKKLKVLKIDNNKLVVLPKSLEQLSSLQDLNAASNKITTSQVEFKNMQKLKELNLTKNQLQEIPLKLNGCKQLSKLIISANKLNKPDFTDISLPNITELNLQSNKLTEIVLTNGLCNISTLNLSSNQLEQLPSNIGGLQKLSTLNLSSNKLAKLPDQICSISTLQTLNLNSNKDICLPQNLSKMKIQILNLRSCNYTDFPLLITDLKFLKKLEISFNNIQIIPDKVKELKNLEVLNIESNKIAQFPSALLELKNLNKFTYMQNSSYSVKNIINLFLRIHSSTLDLSSRKIESLPELIVANSDIQTLKLNTNLLQRIPPSIQNLHSLKTLNLSGNKLTQLCEEVFNLRELTQLNLQNNNLESVPDKFDRLKNLTSLKLINNKIKVIPSSLEFIFKRNFVFTYSKDLIKEIPDWLITNDLTSTHLQLNDRKLSKLPKFHPQHSLRTVMLHNNLFEKFPSNLLVLQATLISINLNKNMIKKIPEGIKRLARLSKLCFQGNLLEQIPPELCQLPLTILEIENNPLKKVPQQFSKLKNVTLRISPEVFKIFKENQCLQYVQPKVLNLKGLMLETLPEEMQELTEITELSLQQNLFKYLPESILKMKGLRKLDLRKNIHLEKLPEQISQLENLLALQAQDCKINKLPELIGKLTKLKDINLSGNQLSYLPSQMQQLKSISLLNLSNNLLSEVSCVIGKQSEQFNNLTLSHNKITVFSDSIVRIPILKILDLSHNLIEVLPVAINEASYPNKGLQLLENPIKEVGDYATLSKKFTTITCQYLKKFETETSKG